MIHTIAIIGGGPAGARTAEMLAPGGRQAGTSGAADQSRERGRVASRERWERHPRRVLVFEEKLGWEKPCGGGLTQKALGRYPFLGEAGAGARLVREAEFIASSGESTRFRLRAPLAIYSRAHLNRLLRARAQQAGAEIIPERILAFRRKYSGWELEGRGRTYEADFLVLAGGARSQLRQVLAEPLAAHDFMLTFGYFLPAAEEMIRIQFFDDFEGYAWVFPRRDHASVGICGKASGEGMAGLRSRLHDFLAQHGYARGSECVFGHLLPSLSVESWGNLRLAGHDWAMVGDVAGLVDPITGEGIYYALRSADLLAEALDQGAPELYPELVRNDFGRGLALCARLANTFYRSQFLGASIPTRMVEFSARSRWFLAFVQDLVEGFEPYPRLAARLPLHLARTLLATGGGRFLEKLGARSEELEARS